MPRQYHTAQICLNGHIITDSIQIDPKPGQKYCDECGAELITACQKCNSNIRGLMVIPDPYADRMVDLNRPPQFCYNCGNPYPWIESKIQAAQELAYEIENISKEDIEVLANSINDIVKDTPKTQVAAVRFTKILSRTGKEAINIFRDLLVDIASETAKKVIWPE